jgi:hypothetical protein
MLLKYLSQEQLHEIGSRLFEEVKTWGLGQVIFYRPTSPGTYYIQTKFGRLMDKEWVTIRVSSHIFTRPRQAKTKEYYFNLDAFDSEAECLVEAKRKALEVEARIQALPKDSQS